MMILRHLLSIAILPFTMTILVPLWIAGRTGTLPALGASPAEVALQTLGGVLLVIGLRLFAASLARFAVEGKGTLAPWDPPRHLVVRGPYRYVRNPMISGLVSVLFGEAALLQSLPHLEWSLIFLAASVVFIPLWEEPDLERRFGEAYREYCRHVPRVIPRLRPWVPPRD